MTKRLTALLVLTVATLLLSAQSFAETKIAVMNYQVVLFNSEAANDATLSLREQLAAEQKRLQDIQQQIESRQSRLETDKDILTDDELQEFREVVQRLLAERAQLSAALQQAQQVSRNAFVQQYQPVIREIVAKYVKDKKITLVVDTQAVLWNEGEPDLTDDILKLFDQKYAEIKKAQ